MRRVLICLLFAAVSAMAQGPGMFAWWDSPIARDLKLKDEQNKQINAVLREYRPQMTQLRATLENAEGDLADIMNEDTVDTSKANDAIEKVIAARSEMTRVVSRMSLRLRTVLTGQQWRELQRRQPQRFGGGPGGPGPPPPDGNGGPPPPRPRR